jgi:hypothetical protein
MSEEELRRLTNWQNSGMSRAVFEKEWVKGNDHFPTLQYLCKRILKNAINYFPPIPEPEIAKESLADIVAYRAEVFEQCTQM